ncbi:MAG: hypothetical protein AAFX06_30455 [Planctomycetota bacterium]
MLRADVHKPFFRKFLFVFLGCLGYSGLCLKDGLWAYPKKLTVAMAYEELPEEGREEAWEKLAAEKGWPPVAPAKEAKKIRQDIGTQFLQIALCMLFGVPAVMMWMGGQGTWIEGDESILRNSKGVEVPIESITKIDKRKWPEKGIAKIYYEVDGKTKKFVMDDFKYNREAMGELMKFAEANLVEDQLIGDGFERDKFEEEEYDEDVDGEELDEEEYEELVDQASEEGSDEDHEQKNA